MVEQILLEYVEQLYVLESERNTLEEMRTKLYRIREEANKQKLPEELHISTPSLTDVPSGAGGGFALFIGIIFMVVALVSIKSSSFWIYAIIGIAIFCWGYSNVKKKEEIVERNEQRIEEAKNQAEHELEQVKQGNMSIRELCNAIDTRRKEIEKCITEKDNALQTLYNYDIIHNSYRNLYGMSKIYYLLDTGICSALEGADGAYSQMRIDQIIENQKISIDMLSEIRTTNQMMYKSINETNALLRELNYQCSANSLQNEKLLMDIKDNVAINNFLLESGNSDRKALTKSVEYLAYAEKQKRIAEGHFN